MYKLQNININNTVQQNTGTRLFLSYSFLDAEYKFVFQIASSRHNFKEIAIKIAKKDCFIISQTLWYYSYNMWRVKEILLQSK